MLKHIKILLFLPMFMLAVILLLSWSFYGELFLSFLPYLVGIYAVYLVALMAYLILAGYELKKINSFWLNWLVVFFLFLGIFSFYFDLGASATDERSSTVKVISANLWYQNEDVSGMQKFFENEDADVIMVTEFTEFQHRYLTEYLEENYPYQNTYLNNLDNVPYIGKAIYSKHPLIGRELPVSRHAELFLAGTAFLDDKEINLLMVHTTAPVNTDYFASRNQQLTYLQDVVDEGLSGTTVISGDFNVSPWSPRFVKLDRSLNVENFGRVRNNKLDFSWYYRPAAFFKSQIDHTFVSDDLQVVSYELKEFPGSDHKAQVFTVSWD